MAGGESPDCCIVPTRESHIFRFRVRFPSPLGVISVITRCYSVVYFPARKSTRIKFRLGVSKSPVLEPAAKVSTHMVLLDKTGSPAPSIGKTLELQGAYFLEAEIDDVKANCVVDDYFDVLCNVGMDGTPPASSSSEEELPDLGHDLAMMSDKQEFTDVSFDVGGESFSAHRLVLAARSPVFKAELYGPMAESKMASITVKDMEASTFRSMLHYMYHGSLPAAGREEVSSTMAQYQHLVEAADRYGLEGLKKICEEKLCVNGVKIDSVVSMLELAEDHVCPKLKAACLDFLADGEHFMMVATSGEYIRLMQSFPTLLVEVRNRIKIAHEESTIINSAAHKKSRVC
ncbi:unnamed protein product [Alopecurus aequalis]